MNPFYFLFIIISFTDCCDPFAECNYGIFNAEPLDSGDIIIDLEVIIEKFQVSYGASSVPKAYKININIYRNLEMFRTFRVLNF